MATYLVTGHIFPTGALGTYTESGTYGGEPAYTNGTYWRWWDGMMYLISSPKGYMLSEYWQEVGTVSPTTANPMNGAVGVVTVTLVTFVITASAGAGGSVSPTTATVASGDSQTFSFTPSAGYIVNTVTVDGVAVTKANSYTFTNVLATHTLAVTFILYHTITVTAGSGGSVSPTTVQVAEGSFQTFTVTPSSGGTISGVLVDGVSVGAVASYTFTSVYADHTISASFATPTAAWAKEVEYLAEKNAHFIKYEDNALLFRRELVRGWPMERDALLVTSLEYLRQYASAQNTSLVERQWVRDPLVSGKIFLGLWRVASNARVTYENEAQIQEQSGIVQTLRYGFAQALEWDEVRIINNKQMPASNSSSVPTISDTTSDDPEDFLQLEFVNLDPEFTRNMVKGLGDTVTINTALATRFGLYNTHATYPAYAQGDWHVVSATILESELNDGSARIQVLLARPQYTLEAYRTYVSFFNNYRYEGRTYYLWQVPKDIAQTIITAWKANGRSASASYGGSGLVDLVLSEVVYPDGALYYDAGLTAFTCSSEETTTFIWGVYDPTGSMYSIGTHTLAGDPGYTITKDIRLNRDEGRFDIEIHIRHTKERNVSWATTGSAALSHEDTYQQFGLDDAGDVVSIESPAQGLVYRQDVQINPDCSRDAKTVATLSVSDTVEFKHLQSTLQGGSTKMYQNSRSVITVPAGYTGKGVYRVDQTENSDGSYRGDLKCDLGVPDSFDFRHVRTFVREGATKVYKNSSSVITIPPGLTGAGVYRVDQTENVDGSYDGALVYEGPTGEGVVPFQSELTVLNTTYEVLYEHRSDALTVPSTGQTGLYRVTQTINLDDGSYSGRQIYVHSVYDTFTFKHLHTFVQDGSSIIYRNCRSVITVPSYSGTGVYTASQTENEDGTYDGVLKFEGTSGTGYGAFHSESTVFSEGDTIFYDHWASIIEAPNSDQAGLYRAVWNLNLDDGTYSGRLVYALAEAGGVYFKQAESILMRGYEVLYKNSRAAIEPPGAVGAGGVYQVAQTINDDGTYNGSLVYRIGLPAGDSAQTLDTHLSSQYTTKEHNQESVDLLAAAVSGVTYGQNFAKNELGLFDGTSEVTVSHADGLYTFWTDNSGNSGEYMYVNWPNLVQFNFGPYSRGDVTTALNADATYNIRASCRPMSGGTSASTAAGFYFYRTHYGTEKYQGKTAPGFTVGFVAMQEYVRVSYHASEDAAYLEAQSGYNAKVTSVGGVWRCEKVIAANFKSDAVGVVKDIPTSLGINTLGTDKPTFTGPPNL